MDPSEALTVTTDAVATVQERHHRAGVFVARADEAGAAVPQVRFLWEQSDGRLLEGDWTDTVEVETSAAGFQRYETAADGEPAPIDTVGVGVELRTETGVEAIDNLMLWTSTPPCFDACGG